MTKYRTMFLLTACVLLAATGLQADERWPSSQLLLPCFEVLVDPAELTPSLDTFFSVVNSGERALPIRIEVLSNWGVAIEELESRLTLGPGEVEAFRLGGWIVDGELPGRDLSSEQLAHVQAALTGQAGPDSGLYYSTPDPPAAPWRAVGSVVVTVERVSGRQSEKLWGDFFIVRPAERFAQGEVLVNLDRTVSADGTNDDDLCRVHALRFLQGGGFNAGTELMVWNRYRGEPSETPFFAAPVPVSILAYDEAGRHVATVERELEPLQWLRVAELGLPVDFGWLRVRTETTDTFITVRYSASGRYSAGFEAFCMEE